MYGQAISFINQPEAVLNFHILSPVDRGLEFRSCKHMKLAQQTVSTLPTFIEASLMVKSTSGFRKQVLSTLLPNLLQYFNLFTLLYLALLLYKHGGHLLGKRWSYQRLL